MLYQNHIGLWLKSKASNSSVFWKLLDLKLGKHTWITT